MNAHCLLFKTVKQTIQQSSFHQLQFILKMTAIFTDTRMQSNTPLLHCSVDDILTDVTPLFDQMLLRVVDVVVD